MRFFLAPCLLSLISLLLCAAAADCQAPDTALPEAPRSAELRDTQPTAAQQADVQQPDAQQPDGQQQAKQLGTHPAQTPAEAAEALRISKLAVINGRPYDQPSTHDTLVYYAKDTYLLPALVNTTLRTVYSQARGKPVGWGTDFPGFMQRFGSAYAVTAINGNVRLAMELTFKEDLRYYPCHGCSVKRKIENSLLAEITARHSEDGHRFFTLTPTIADFSGPIIAHSYWYPKGFDPLQGVIATRLVFATRIGVHLFQEFVLERRHKDQHVDR